MPALARRIAKVSTSVSITHANSPFDRFGPLKKVPIRTPPKKDRLERLRELRDSLKSGNLSPETIRSMLDFSKGLTFIGALELAQREGRLIVPNSVHETVIRETNVGYSVWTGTLVVYDAHNKPFGDLVVFTWTNWTKTYNVIFQVPESFRGKTNCALIVEHPDFEIVKIKENTYEIKLVDGAEVRLVHTFIERWERFAPDDFTHLNGAEAELALSNRYVIKLGDSSHVSLLVRNHHFWFRFGSNIYPSYTPRIALV